MLSKECHSSEGLGQPIPTPVAFLRREAAAAFTVCLKGELRGCSVGSLGSSLVLVLQGILQVSAERAAECHVLPWSQGHVLCGLSHLLNHHFLELNQEGGSTHSVPRILCPWEALLINHSTLDELGCSLKILNAAQE